MHPAPGPRRSRDAAPNPLPLLAMQLTVLLFASYAERLGGSSVSVTVGDGATVSDLLGRIAALPGADTLPPAPLVAVNQRYAAEDQVLRPGDEVALIPPVAGG